MPAQFTGGNLISVGGFAGVGNPGNLFSGKMLLNQSKTTPTTLTLHSLPTHSYLGIGFLMAIIDSWDGSNLQRRYGPDIFNITVDGTSVFSHTFSQYFPVNQSYVAPAHGKIASGGKRVRTAQWSDSAYDMYLEPTLQLIPHTASSATIRFFGSGAGYQGSTDESFALENLRITAGTAVVPEPASMLLMGSAICALVAWKRSRQ